MRWFIQTTGQKNTYLFRRVSVVDRYVVDSRSTDRHLGLALTIYIPLVD